MNANLTRLLILNLSMAKEKSIVKVILQAYEHPRSSYIWYPNSKADSQVVVVTLLKQEFASLIRNTENRKVMWREDTDS